MTNEPISVNPAVNRKIVQWVIVIIVLGIILYLLNGFAEGGVMNILFPLIGLLLFLWMFFARDAWWVLLPLTLSFGGMFYFGFKVYSHEVGLILCFLPLLPMLAIRKNWKIKREPLPRSVFILLAYFVVHMAVSLYLCRVEGLAGAGNIMRVYMRGLWPLIFAVPFYTFGSTKHLRAAMIAMYVGAFLHVLLGVVGFFSPQLLYVPFINFVLPGTYTAGAELRESALFLIPLCICFASVSKNWLVSVVNVLVAIGAGVGILLGGGRASLGILCVIPLLWAFFQRRFIVMGATVVALATMMFVLNTNTEIIYRFPYSVQRTLSIFVLRSPVQSIHSGMQSSDEWHYGLMIMGSQKWLSSPGSFLFGNRILPFTEDFESLSIDFGEKMRISADLGYYESGLWTVLAVIGAVGALLYGLVFFGLLRKVPATLFKDGISDYRHAFYFLATSGFITWAVFSWIVGHFPSQELMMAILARAAYEDQRTARQSPQSPPEENIERIHA